MAWIEEKLVEGCNTTRSKTSLRSGELQSAAFVQLRPGDKIQLDPDVPYTKLATLFTSTQEDDGVLKVLGQWNLTFEGGRSYLAVATYTHSPSPTTSGRVTLRVYDVSLLITGAVSTPTPSYEKTYSFDCPVDTEIVASLVSRGAEYFFSAASPETEIGELVASVLSYDSGIQARELGIRSASNITIEIGENYPSVGWDDGSGTTGLFLSEWPYPDTPGVYGYYDLLNRDLFGNQSNFQDAYPEVFDKKQLYDLFVQAVLPGTSIARWVPITGVRLISSGDAYVFAYYCTLYNSETGVESGPSDLLFNTNLSAAGAQWEIDLNLNDFFAGVDEWGWDPAAVEREQERAPAGNGNYQDLLRYLGEGADEFANPKARGYRWALLWEYLFGPNEDYPYSNYVQFAVDAIGLGYGVVLWYNISDTEARNRVKAQLGESSGLYHYLFENGDGSPDLTLTRAKRVKELYDLWKAGDTPGIIKVNVPLSAKQRAEIDTTLDISFRDRGDADMVRLYRQNLGNVPGLDAAVEYGEGVNAYTPISVPDNGDIIKLATDIQNGRATRSGGLLEEWPTGDVPSTYIDNLDESGVADPAQPYPTIAQTTSRGFAIYEYLRRPDEHSIAANFGQSMLRVETGVGTNILLASPTEQPEVAPLIYAIPVVSDRQDEIKALRNIRDTMLVFTENSTFRLNYIPFENTVAQDRVLTQISSYHGCCSPALTETIETHAGQYAAWLSQTMLAGSNGNGFFDMCPDWSVESAFDGRSTVAQCVLVNNPRRHRLELWEKNRRWDFYYHRSQMKDIRGDGSGLVFKMMGPSPWYGDAERVVAACNCEVDGALFVYHLVESRSPSGAVAFDLVRETFASDPEAHVSRRAPDIRTRALTGTSPAHNKKTKRIALQHADLDFLAFTVGAQDGGVGVGHAGTNRGSMVRLDNVRDFSILTPEDGFHSKLEYRLTWAGGPAGPLWLDLEEMPGGFGR